ncbi:MAG: hypothetical protein UR22_C0029G0001, partial [Parcubacteria group bacterium GW2011_GWC2_32_10]
LIVLEIKNFNSRQSFPTKLWQRFQGPFLIRKYSRAPTMLTIEGEALFISQVTSTGLATIPLANTKPHIQISHPQSPSATLVAMTYSSLIWLTGISKKLASLLQKRPLAIFSDTLIARLLNLGL